MKRWAAVGIGVLLMLWVPFLYWQLQTSPAPAAAPEPAPAEPAPAEPPVEQPPAEPSPQPSAPSAQGEPAAPQPAPAPAAPAPAAPAPAAPPSQPDPAADEVGPDGLPKNIPVPAGGPVVQLKAAYEGSSRDAEAPAIETEIRAQFGKDDVPAEMLRSVSCHKDACKVDVLWSRERVLPFMRLAMTWGQRFGMEIGSEAGPTDGSGFTPLTVYIARGKGPDRPPSE